MIHFNILSDIDITIKAKPAIGSSKMIVLDVNKL